MADAHDLAVVGPRRHLELVRDRASTPASGSARRRSRAADRRRSPVRRGGCGSPSRAGAPSPAPSRRRTPRRSPGARGTRRASASSSAELADQLDRGSRRRPGRPGPGETTTRSGASARASSGESASLLLDDDLGSQLLEEVDEVVGERVVVVDHQHPHPLSVPSARRRTAATERFGLGWPRVEIGHRLRRPDALRAARRRPRGAPCDRARRRRRSAPRSSAPGSSRARSST